MEGGFFFVHLFARVEDKWLMLAEVSSVFVLIMQLWSENIHVTNLSISTMFLTVCHVVCQINCCCFHLTLFLENDKPSETQDIWEFSLFCPCRALLMESVIKNIQTMLVGPLASKLTFLTQCCCSAVNDSSPGRKSTAMSIIHFSKPRVVLVLWGCRRNF